LSPGAFNLLSSCSRFSIKGTPANFLTIAQGKTTIIVSHRTGLCTLVDKIAVMSKGELVEFGTHKELMKRAGEYSKLFNAQRQWYI